MQRQWAKVVVLGDEEKLEKFDDWLEKLYRPGIVLADEGGDGWAAYLVEKGHLGRFRLAVARHGCSVYYAKGVRVSD